MLVEFENFNQYNILKNENKYLQNMLERFTKGRENLNLLLGNKKTSYNKVCISYEAKNNNKTLVIFAMLNQCQNAKP